MRSHDAFVCRHDLARACRVLEIMKYKFFALMLRFGKNLVWESFQTPIFTLLVALHDIFSRHREILWEITKIY